MNEFSFEVTKTGWIHVEADSVEDAEARLQENFGHFYVITRNWRRIVKWLGNHRRSRTRPRVCI